MGRSRRSGFAAPSSWFVRLYDAESSESLSCCVFLLGLALFRACGVAGWDLFFFFYTFSNTSTSNLPRGSFLSMYATTNPAMPVPITATFLRSVASIVKEGKAHSFRRGRAYLVPRLRGTENLGSYDQENRLKQMLTMGIMQHFNISTLASRQS